MKNLKAQSIDAVLWSLLERFGQQGIQFIVSVFLARILLPEDFGLIAMLAIILALGNSLIDSGFQKALIQKKVLTYTDECSVFYFNIFIALIITGIVFISAPLISQFYDQPQLISISRTLSIVFLFSSFGLVQDSLLAKKLDFKIITKVNVTSSILSGVLSIIMAFKGFGVWSLVMLNAGGAFFRTLLFWIYSSWRPSPIFSFDSLQSMYSFGSRLFIVSLTNSVFTNIYQVIIGKLFSVASLGFYSRAKTLSMYPVTVVTSVVNQVSFPVFSKIQDDKTRLKNYMQRTLTMLTVVTFPLMIGIAIVAKPLILILLTEKWLPSVPFFQMLCVVGMLYPIHVVNLNSLNARGRSDLYLKIDIINKVMILLVVLITYRFGISAMIIGQIINAFIAYYFYAYYSGKHLQYSIGMQLRDMFPGLSAALLMGSLVYSLKYFIIENNLVLLIAQISSGVIIYTGLCFIFKIKAFFKGLEIINSFYIVKLKGAR